MRYEEQIRRHHDGSIDVSFYARRAASARADARREAISRLFRALASTISRMTKGFSHRAR